MLALLEPGGSTNPLADIAERALGNPLFEMSNGTAFNRETRRICDAAAIRIARVLYYMCSDACESLELWHGTGDFVGYSRPISKPAWPI